jgi:hypothetical protein
MVGRRCASTIHHMALVAVHISCGSHGGRDDLRSRTVSQREEMSSAVHVIWRSQCRGAAFQTTLPCITQFSRRWVDSALDAAQRHGFFLISDVQTPQIPHFLCRGKRMSVVFSQVTLQECTQLWDFWASLKLEATHVAFAENGPHLFV